MSETKCVQVLVSVAIGGTYNYQVPLGIEVKVGSIVKVPFGSRFALGVVWGWCSGEGENYQLKAISQTYDYPPLNRLTLQFVDWVSNYTMSSPGMVLRMVVSKNSGLEHGIDVNHKVLRLTGDKNSETGSPKIKITASGEKVLRLFQRRDFWFKRDLIKQALVSASVVDRLIRLKVLEWGQAPLPKLETLDPDHWQGQLNPDQARAAEVLTAGICEKKFAVYLLDGVTGSGKTLVYFEAVARVLETNKQALIMVPEIALTSGFVAKFIQRFKAAPGLWHSEMTITERARVWRGVILGQLKVVIGTRSALFLPFNDLGLIVVDEEHDAGYKQSERVIYNARDMSVARGRLGEFLVILSSATPSMETFANVMVARYRKVALPKRYFGGALPEIKIIDLYKLAPEPGSWLSPSAVDALSGALDRQQQGLLFLNRRGYAPLTLCRKCGHRFSCPNCSSWLVEHRAFNVIICHHCGYRIAKPDHCPECDSDQDLVVCGPGVERIAEETAERWPAARQLILSSDHTAAKIHYQLDKIGRGDIDLIIATQLIAKGHHFPRLTTVVVVDADLGLDNGDPRAGERCFQLLTQVAGRAGREGMPGRVWLQSYAPNHPLIAALGSGRDDEFYRAEIAIRKQAKFPPFGRLAGLIISAKKPDSAKQYARAMVANVPANNNQEVSVLGPVEAPMAFIRGRYRLRFLVRSKRNFKIQSYITTWLARCQRPTGDVRVQIDIDPLSFL